MILNGFASAFLPWPEKQALIAGVRAELEDGRMTRDVVNIIAAAAAAVAARLGDRRPEVAIVLGSGLGGVADRVHDAVRIGYADIPGLLRADGGGASRRAGGRDPWWPPGHRAERPLPHV